MCVGGGGEGVWWRRREERGKCGEKGREGGEERWKENCLSELVKDKVTYFEKFVLLKHLT